MEKTCKTCTHLANGTSEFCAPRGSYSYFCAMDRNVEQLSCPDWEPKAADQSLKADAVNHPSHYTQGGVVCIDAIKAATTGLSGFEAYCTGNIIKCLWRWKHKNGVQDLEKARWHLDRLIAEEKMESDNECS